MSAVRVASGATGVTAHGGLLAPMEGEEKKGYFLCFLSFRVFPARRDRRRVRRNHTRHEPHRGKEKKKREARPCDRQSGRRRTRLFPAALSVALRCVPSRVVCV